MQGSDFAALRKLRDESECEDSDSELREGDKVEANYEECPSELDTVPSSRECRVDGPEASAPTQARQVLQRQDLARPRR